MNRFDNEAKNWDKNTGALERATIFAREIKQYLKPNTSQNALEFGCGTGLLSFELQDVFNTITLVDTSQGMIEVLKEKIEAQGLSHFTPVLADLLQEGSNITGVDVLYTLMTLHHINDLSQIFKVFYTMLAPNGYLCIADLVKEDGTFHPAEMNFDGHHGFDKEKLSAELAAHGFETVSYSIPYSIEKQHGTTVKKYPLFLLIAKKVP